MTKSTKLGDEQLLQKLELVGDDGVRFVALTFGVTLYTNKTLSTCAEAVLNAYQQFQDACPLNTLKFYATENMRKHKAIAKSTLTMLPTWLKPGAPAREYIFLQLKDGDDARDAPHRKFEIYGLEPKSKLFNAERANLVSWALPLVESVEGAEKMLDRFTALCEAFPFRSGHAGFSFECSRYEREISETHAWTQSMRYRGVDICRIPADSKAVGRDGIKGIGWLTALDEEFVSMLGGAGKIRKTLSREIDVLELSRGIVIRAGSVPSAVDSNRGESLPLYKSVYRLAAPFIERAAIRATALTLATDYVERTERWFTRLGIA
jgi:hypothetical protein